MRTNRAFTMIELMITVALIALVAGLSMPKVEEWIARQQARQFVSQLIADYSKARAIAGASFIHDPTAGSVSNQSALYFQNLNGQSSYTLLTRNSPNTTAWTPGTDPVVRKVALPSRIHITSINDSNSILNNAVVIAFTSAGVVKDGGNNRIVLNPAFRACGPGQGDNQKRYTLRLIFDAFVNSNTSLLYRVEINTVGEYRICQAFGGTNFVDNGVELKSL